MAGYLFHAKSGYYKWLNQSDHPEKVAYKKELEQKIAKSFHESEGTYGSPRVHKDLLDWGYSVSLKTVARFMRQMGLKATPSTPYVVTTDSSHDLPIYKNVLNRQFTVKERNQVWVSDITYIRTLEGWVYLASLMDLYSRKIVGWSTGVDMKKELTLEALNRALIARKPVKGLIHHSDRGSQYCSREYIEVLTSHHIQIQYESKRKSL